MFVVLALLDYSCFHRHSDYSNCAEEDEVVIIAIVVVVIAHLVVSAVAATVTS